MVRRRFFSPDLLAYELCNAGIVVPLAQEELAQKRVQGLFLVAIFLAACGILLLQGCQEPLEHQHGALRRIGFLCGRSENSRMFAPVGAVLGQGDAGEDEGRRGQAGQVAIEGGDGLNMAHGRVNCGSLPQLLWKLK